jgi:hypothetical protein
MSKILLLYDTKEKDLGRDLSDFMGELGIEIRMIPDEPNLGKTLQDKETHYFKGVEGAVFLITPGSVRDGHAFPSPSVAHEMGQAGKQFEGWPERLIFLVDKDCKVPSIDQHAHISFDRKDVRSVVSALTQLVRDLKAAKLTGQTEIVEREVPGVDIKAVANETDDGLKNICIEMSNHPGGILGYSEFREILKTKFGLSEQEINFAQRDLQTHGLVDFDSTSGRNQIPFFALTSVGWELVRYEIKVKPQATLLDVFKAALDTAEGFSRYKPEAS